MSRTLSPDELTAHAELDRKRAALYAKLPGGTLLDAMALEDAAHRLGMLAERRIVSRIYGVPDAAPACENCNSAGCARCGRAA